MAIVRTKSTTSAPRGMKDQQQPEGTITDPLGHARVIAVVLAFPVAITLATGVEAPSSAIAQPGQLDDAGRSRFGRITLWLTVAIVGSITLGLALEAAHKQVGSPPEDSTQIAELARLAAPGPVFAAFQLVTALVLLSAASSSFQAGPGLARHTNRQGATVGILPPAVFLSFLAGLLSMALFSHRDRRRGYLIMNIAGAAVVAFTLIANLSRGLPAISLAAALIIAAVLHGAWVRAGRPRGIRNVAAEAQEIPE